MGEPEFIDRLRDWAQGRLDLDERASLEAELDDDFEKARLAEEYAEVEAWLGLVEETSSGDGAASAEPATDSRLEWTDLAARLDASPEEHAARDARRLPLRLVAAALVVLGVGLVFLRPETEKLERPSSQTTAPVPSTLSLAFIPWEDRPASEDFPTAALAALLEPPGKPSGPLFWYEDEDLARPVSALSGRPLFSVVGLENSRAFEKIMGRLLDPPITRLLRECVLLREERDETGEDPRVISKTGKVPIVRLVRPDGTLLRDFTKATEAGVLEQKLRASLEQLDLWAIDAEAICDWAAVALAAKRDEDAGLLAPAYGAYRDLDELADGALARLGREGMLRIAAQARALVKEALRLEDTDRFVEVLRSARAFVGTPFQADLEALARTAEETGRVPIVESSSAD